MKPHHLFNIVAIIILVLGLTFTLTSCEKENTKIYGQWQGTTSNGVGYSAYVIFNQDKTMEYHWISSLGFKGDYTGTFYTNHNHIYCTCTEYLFWSNHMDINKSTTINFNYQKNNITGGVVQGMTYYKK